MLYILRHGDSLRQKTRKASCWPEKFYCPLTEKGKKQIKRMAHFLESKDISQIFSSDLLRTKETSKIVSQITGAKIRFDKRLREFDVGKFNNRNSLAVWNYLRRHKNPILTKLPQGESLIDLRNRINDFLRDIKKQKHEGNILIVSHELPLTILEHLLKKEKIDFIIEWRAHHRDKLIKPGELRKLVA